MGQTTLTAVTRTSGCTRALKDGTSRPRHYVLRFEEVPVLVQAFRRMVRSVEWDVSEMAFTTYLVAKAHGSSDPGSGDRMYQRVMRITGADPLPYGIAPNRAMIDQLIRHAVDQKILDKPVAAEDVFAAGTHDLAA